MYKLILQHWCAKMVCYDWSWWTAGFWWFGWKHSAQILWFGAVSYSSWLWVWKEILWHWNHPSEASCSTIPGRQYNMSSAGMFQWSEMYNKLNKIILNIVFLKFNIKPVVVLPFSQITMQMLTNTKWHGSVALAIPMVTWSAKSSRYRS